MVVLNEVKIKYDHLDSILKEKIQNIKFTNNITVIIDLKEIFRKIFRPNILLEENINSKTVEEVASDIINIISHYRNYFYKLGKYSSFYFVYSKSECEIMKNKYNGYKEEYYKKYFYDPEKLKKIDTVNKAILIFERIINQIPNCFFIDSSKYDEFIITKFITMKIPKNELVFILSADEIMSQVLSKNTYMINIKGINSKLITEENAVSVLFEYSAKFSSKLIPLISSMTGTGRYNLKNIERIGPSRAIKIIEELLENQKLLDSEYISFPIKLDSLDPKIKLEKTIIDNFNLISNNFDIITSNDVLYSNLNNITTLFNKSTQIYSQNYFLELNSKIFSTYPLSLDMLLKGEF